MIYDWRRGGGRGTYGGTDRQSGGVAPLQLNLSTKEDLQRKCGALFVFTGGRSSAQLVFQFCSQSGFGAKVLSCATWLNAPVFSFFFSFAYVCVSLNLLFGIMRLDFSLKLHFFFPALFQPWTVLSKYASAAKNAWLNNRLGWLLEPSLTALSGKLKNTSSIFSAMFAG